MEADQPQIEVSEPQLFGHIAVFIVNCFPMLLLVPLLTVFAVAVLVIIRIEAQSVALIVLLFHLGLAMAIYFTPFGLGNPYVTHLVGLFTRPASAKRRRFIVQVTFRPRLRTGLRALAEDADDIGVLSFDGSDLIFEGDSVTIKLPFKQISGVALRNVGWRGFWLTGQRVTIRFFDGSGPTTMELVERSSWTISKSRRVTQELCELFQFHLQRHGRCEPFS